MKIKSTGLTARYVYYGCSRSRDRNCKGGYIREENLVTQIIKQIENIEFREESISKNFSLELNRFNHFQRDVLQQNNDLSYKDADLKAYFQYILRHGSIIEKREVINSLSANFILLRKEVTVSSYEPHLG